MASAQTGLGYRKLGQLCTTPVSVAESREPLGALGVARVLITDLADTGSSSAHRTRRIGQQARPRSLDRVHGGLQRL